MKKTKGFVETLLEVLVILFVAVSILFKYVFILCCFILKVARALFIFGYSFYRQKHQQRRQTRNNNNNQNSYSYNRQVYAPNNSGSYNKNRHANKTYGNPIKKLHTPRYRSTPVEVKQEICKLPAEFGKNAKLYTAINNQALGIKHVHERHERDFITTKISSFSNEKHIVKSLQQNLISSKFVGEEIHAKGNRYIWETKNANGKSQHLVTVMEPRGGGDGNNFELITAYKRTKLFLK